MVKKYTSEQFWKLYNNLPQELKDALFAEETGNNIYETCKQNGVLSHHQQIIDYVGQVLLGVLPVEDFQKLLTQELKINKEATKKVIQQINRLIFYPVRPLLEELYSTEILPSSLEKPILTAETLTPEKEESAPPRKDTYREAL